MAGNFRGSSRSVLHCITKSLSSIVTVVHAGIQHAGEVCQRGAGERLCDSLKCKDRGRSGRERADGKRDPMRAS